MSGVTETRLKVYQATALFSVLFALVGFSYNVWRLEVTEHNTNVREASFELLLQLAELEQVVYAAHYDRDLDRGSPRDGWVKVGLINDLSGSCGEAVAVSAAVLKTVWSSNWAQMPEQRVAADAVVEAIDGTRAEVRAVLSTLN